MRADWGVSAVQCASGGAADGTSNPPSQRMIANLRALGHTVDIDDQALAEVGRYFTASRKQRACRRAAPKPSTPIIFITNCRAGWSAPCAGIWRNSASALEGAVIEELGRVRAGTGLADRDDAFRADAA